MRSSSFAQAAFVLVLAGPLSAQVSGWKDPSPHRAHMVRVDSGVSLEVLDWGGRGRTLVLLAQLGQTAHIYDDWAPKLARQFHVVGITRRGIGESQASSGFTIDRVSRDIAAVVESLHVERPILVGNGFAGDEMTWLASHDMTPLGGLVYLDAAYDRSAANGEGGVTRHVPQRAPKPEDMASIESLRRWMQGSAWSTPESETRQTVRVGADGRVLGERSTPGAQQQLTKAIPTPQYASIHVPALAIYAKRNSATLAAPSCRDMSADSVRLACEELAAWLQHHLTQGETEFRTIGGPNRVVELIDASPFVFLSNEEEVTRAIVEFVASLR
jgi:pimeloyl-ACP methyl ester carboxylesterase